MFSWRVYPSHVDATAGSYLTVPSLHDAGIRVAFTARAGGVSGAPFESLNLSYVSDDEPAVVRANRVRALQAIGAPLEAWTSGQQVHGARAQRVTSAERGRGSLDPDDTVRETDALWTDEPGVALGVLTADCVPLLLADPGRRRIATVHVGWRGLVGGIVDQGAGAFEDPAHVVAYIGPSIGPCCFEVGEDVAGPAGEAFGPTVVRRDDGRPRVDLWNATRIALGRADVKLVHTSALCTRCEPHRFFSHRAGHAARQGLLATIAP